MTTIDKRILIGLGCSTSASADEIIALVQHCLEEAGSRPDQIVALASHARKASSTALKQTADFFGVPIFFLGDHALAPGITSTCEAVAAVAGPLRLGKRKSRFATSAIADCAPGFSLESLVQLSSISASNASSTLATSVAGP
jgi:cobalt-precorrin 5A hydrolase/precorrin-3B C17-methyltransferase